MNYENRDVKCFEHYFYKELLLPPKTKNMGTQERKWKRKIKRDREEGREIERQSVALRARQPYV